MQVWRARNRRLKKGGKERTMEGRRKDLLLWLVVANSIRKACIAGLKNCD